MAGDKGKQPIIIKKIIVDGGGGHGGAWKVAFADFMTAMMAFFLVMWLLNSSEETKKQVASYFSGPSVLEQQFKAYGAELTLEKMFLDLMNEPLKTLQTVMEPAEGQADILAMGSKKVVLFHVSQSLAGQGAKIDVQSDRVEITISDEKLFEKGTADPLASEFVNSMMQIGSLIAGLEDSIVYIESGLDRQAVSGKTQFTAENIAQERLDLVYAKMDASIKHKSVSLKARTKISENSAGTPKGYIKFLMVQKEITSDGRKPRKLEDLFESKKDENLDVYNNFVKKVSSGQKRKSPKKNTQQE
ncbi:MAG: chemotaxis protein MotB [Bdellovibrionales bacterium]|nr:chemotaxis protein MotB [Bdellovibrionales bacterium]